MHLIKPATHTDCHCSALELHKPLNALAKQILFKPLLIKNTWLQNTHETKPYSITPSKFREESGVNNLQNRIEACNQFSFLFLLFAFLRVTSYSLQHLAASA